MKRVQEKAWLAVHPRSGHLVGVFKILPEPAILWRSEMPFQYALDMILWPGSVLFPSAGLLGLTFGGWFQWRKGFRTSHQLPEPHRAGRRLSDYWVKKSQNSQTFRPWLFLTLAMGLVFSFADGILIALPAIARWHLRCLYLTSYTINPLNPTGRFVRLEVEK